MGFCWDQVKLCLQYWTSGEVISFHFILKTPRTISGQSLGPTAMLNAYLLHAKRVVYDLFFWSNQNFKRDFWFKISKRKTVIRISSPMSSFKNECLNFSQIEACFEYKQNGFRG